MSRTIIDPAFFTEFEALCSRYGVSMEHDFDNYDQLILYTGLMCKNGDETFEVMEPQDFDPSYNPDDVCAVTVHCAHDKQYLNDSNHFVCQDCNEVLGR
jgi:hypothetical protein